MRILSLIIFSISGGLALAQPPSNAFSQAPPAIDEALRTRVQAFYQAHVDGKFRKADEYVAEDSKDAFFAAEKMRYKSCEVGSISFEENFTKATAVTACKTEMFFHGEKFPVTVPFATHWKVDDGQWFWYYIPSNHEDSPFGTMKAGPESEHHMIAAQIPANMAEAAKKILSQVTMDRNQVTIEQDRNSKQEVHIKNGLMGNVQVSTDPTGMEGLTVRPEKKDVGPGEEIAVIVEFNFDDPDINCKPCLINPGVKPPMHVNVHVQPTNQDFPITIVFAHAAQ
jgi:hypothetical protein